MHGKRSKIKRECRFYLIEHHELMDIAFRQNSVADLAEAVALPNKLDLPAFNKNQYHPNLLVRFLLCKSF